MQQRQLRGGRHATEDARCGLVGGFGNCDEASAGLEIGERTSTGLSPITTLPSHRLGKLGKDGGRRVGLYPCVKQPRHGC